MQYPLKTFKAIGVVEATHLCFTVIMCGIGSRCCQNLTTTQIFSFRASQQCPQLIASLSFIQGFMEHFNTLIKRNKMSVNIFKKVSQTVNIEILFVKACMVQWIKHWFHNPKVVGFESHCIHHVVTNAGFRLTCRLPHCRFDDDICTTAQAPLAAEG